MTEYEMQQNILIRLQCSPRIEAVATEVSVTSSGGHYADICTIESGLLIAYELKLTYCERAVEQALNYTFWGADKSYVVTPEKRITKKARERFEKSGIGLMFWIPPVTKTKQIGCTQVPVRVDFTYPLETIIESTIKRPVESGRYRKWNIEFVKWQHEEFLKIARHALQS